MILAVPPAFLKQLGVGAGSEVGLTLESDRLIVQPQRNSRRYTLDELLSQCDASARPAEEDREWMELAQTPITLPITTGGYFARTAGFAVDLTGCGARKYGVIRCDQPRALDIGARGGQRVERVPLTILDDVLARLSTLLG